MRETHVVYKIQPETRIRKDLQFKKEYAALQKKINIRQGVEQARPAIHCRTTNVFRAPNFQF